MAPLTDRRAGSERPRHVVIVGAGSVGLEVAGRLPAAWTVVVVDLSAEVEPLLRLARPDARLVVGDATSRLTLDRCELDPRSVLVAATGDDAVNREAARVAGLHFGVEERVVVASQADSAPEDGGPAPEVVRPADAVAGRVVNRISIEASRAVDVGLGIGEILQVTVLEGSPAVGRVLRDFSARHWLVAAVYRSGTLVVPHGDTLVQAGDRVLLVGDPADLQDIAPYFRGGAPVFPSQYGALVAWSGNEATAAFAETFAALVGAAGAVPMPADLAPGGPAPPLDSRAWLDGASVGCLVLPAINLPWFVRLGLVRSNVHAALTAIRRPFVVVRAPNQPIRRVLVAIRDARAQREVLLAGIDLARQVGATIEALTVVPQGGGSGDLGAQIDRIARLYGVEIGHRVVPGNPVAAIRAAAAAGDLLVVGFRSEHNSPFAPDVSTFLLHDLPVTAVFVPWSAAG